MEYLRPTGRPELDSDRRHCICPCGRDLEMPDPHQLPYCGDEDCAEYLRQHPEYYDEVMI